MRFTQHIFPHLKYVAAQFALPCEITDTFQYDANLTYLSMSSAYNGHYEQLS